MRSGSEFVRRHRDTLHMMIAANQAQLGIAFDGDADRVVFLTPKGVLIDGGSHPGTAGRARLKAQGDCPATRSSPPP